MPRQARSAPAGQIYHVTNRANGGIRLFEKKADFEIFEKVLADALERVPTRLLGWCLMGDHWHLIIWPKKEGELSNFMRWVTVTHSQRRHSHRKSTGQGHIYQGRFRSFPIEKDQSLLTVLRYVERNAQRAKKVKRAEDWRWSSLWVREQGSPELRAMLSDCPVAIPRNWVELVNRPESPEELEALRTAVRRSAPFGSPKWVLKTATKLGLESSLRPRGRPRKYPAKPTPAAKAKGTRKK
ncbi:MAG TPA: transposase [Tepidisphaeraceae bacterium]|jgi:putative transposase|nr:transposase [Tepidisphaeraceae bacterium]